MFDAPQVIEIVLGAIAGLLVVAASWFAPEPLRRPMVLWAVLAAIVFVERGEAGVLLIVAVAAAIASERVQDHRVRSGAFAAALAAVTAAAVGTESGMLLLGAVIVSLLLWPVLAWHLRAHGPLTLAFVLVGTTAGIYANVPDTEQITLLGAGLGVIAAIQLVIRPARAPWHIGGVAVVGAMIVAAGAAGAIGRPDSFVAVIGALGVLFAEPLAALVRRNTRAKPILLVVLHTAAAIGVSRAAGERPADEAVLIVAGTLAALALLLASLPRNAAAEPH